MSGFDLPGLGLPGLGLPGPGLADLPWPRARLQGGDELRPRLLGEGVDGGESHRAMPFGGLLADAIERVDGLQRDVRSKTEALAVGEPVALHDIMLSMGKSEVAFNLMLEVRNKLVDAWEKLSRAVV